MKPTANTRVERQNAPLVSRSLHAAAAWYAMAVLLCQHPFQVQSFQPPRLLPSGSGYGSRTRASPVSRSVSIASPVSSDSGRSGATGGGDDDSGTLDRSPLAMTIDELSTHLGGRGRALAAWDCYRVGVDPLLYFNDAGDGSVPDSALDSSVSAVMGNILETTREDIQQHLPVKRRTEGMGREALARLSALTAGGANAGGGGGGGVEKSIGTLSHVSTSSDGTTKLLIKMASDGLEVETVIIPWEERNRSTLCVSSQVGCRQGCTFCATGRMGKLRSLTVDEILVQVWFSRKVCRTLNIPTVDNVVFMGMGEPADNSEAVVPAAEALADRQRFELAQSRVTISTVAPDPEAFRTLAAAPAVLAWSVHATRDELRKALVPTTRYSMEQLRRGFVEALLTRTKKLRTSMLEVALIDGVNDGIEEAEHLADFAKRIADDVPGSKIVVNLIPFNDIGHPTYSKPSPERVRAFQNKLMELGVMVYVRTTRGDDESAACGQLATKKKKKIEEVVL